MTAKQFIFQPLLAVCLLFSQVFAQDTGQVKHVVGNANPLRKKIETADFDAVIREVKSLSAKHTASKVLLVVDVDNTLLAMNQDLGSDQWFNWQNSLREPEPTSEDLISPDFPVLLQAQGVLFALGGMHPPEPALPAMIKDVQQLGVPSVVLTSRGPNFRDATERELEANGYSFAKTALSIREMERGQFLPFDPSDPDAHGLNATIIESIKKSLRPVSYSKGIYMTAGQHKGYMLRTLIGRMPGYVPGANPFKAIVFVDDHEKHTQRMHDAYRHSPVDLATFRYSREDGNVAKFNNSSKRHVVRGWRRLQRSIDDVFVK